MADTKISALSAVSSVVGAQEIPVNDAGTTKKATVTQLMAFQGDALSNTAGAAGQAPTAATLTYLTGSNIAVPVGKLRIGTIFRWRLDITKTAAGTAARNFHVRIGTAGTTADTAVLTFLSALGTAAIDTAYIEIMVTIRGPLSASCIARGVYRMQHKLAVTGFSTLAQHEELVDVTSGVFDATTANLIVGLSVTTGASEAITVQQLDAEAKNL